MFDLITRLIAGGGVWGVFLLMLVENLVPVIPSEIIMPMAGFEAALGHLSFVAVVLVGTLGSTVGAVAWYGFGRWLGLERMIRWSERHGRWLTLTPGELRRAHGWFERYGALAVCVGRTLPGVRGVICIPAGVSGMPFVPFLIWSSVGSLIWCALLTGAGALLQSRFTLLDRWLNPLTTAFVVFGVGIYVLRVATFKGARP